MDYFAVEYCVLCTASSTPLLTYSVPRTLLPAAALALATLSTATASGQIATEDQPSAGPRYGEAQTIRFRVGAEITASRGACRNIVAMVAVPLECPEQQVQDPRRGLFARSRRGHLPHAAATVPGR